AQIALYDLALSAAELEAARVAIAYASGSSEQALRSAVALTFCAEALGNLGARLDARRGDYGLARDASFSWRAPISGCLESSALEALGQGFVERSAAPMPDDLDDEKRLIRRTFREFADKRVKPLAAAIHRDDAMIPNELIEGLKSLGCFGLSVPQRFGGLN